MKQKIIPHLWFDTEAEEAAVFYTSLFKDSKIKDKTVLNDTPSGTAQMLTIELAGQDFMLISAGPFFKFTPAVSFLIACDSQKEVEVLWEKLSVGGEAMMPLGAYPFSEKYGWVADRYGLSWQIMYMGSQKITQKITPTLMFVGDQYGKTEEAVNFYVSLFDDSEVGDILRYGEGAPPDKPESIQHVEFSLANQRFAAMDSAYDHQFTFTEAISFVVNCDTQEEIDHFWYALSAVPEAEQCGWLKDRYGFSWQIVPTIMAEMMKDGDPEKLAKVTAAFLKMKKFDIEELTKAWNS
ncbi:MAG: VOC family protein [Acetobacterium sp.]|nr:VOC family protein [Bacillota bacterium]MCG2731103.1 VOC family protein [Acetobacterium sp.]